MTGSAQQPDMTVTEFIEMVKEWLLAEEGPAGANLELLHTEEEISILVAFFAGQLYAMYWEGRSFGRTEAYNEGWYAAFDYQAATAESRQLRRAHA